MGNLLYGDAGNDTVVIGDIAANFGADGGADDDLFLTRAGRVIGNIEGSTGNDTLDASDMTGLLDALTVNLGAGTLVQGGNFNLNLFNVENVIGTQASDRLTGSSGANLLDGQGGNDTIIGGAGIDTLLGGAGNDLIYGDDSTPSSSAGDTFDGGSGNDTIIAANGADTISGGTGNDTLSGGNSSDWLQGDQGNDDLTGGADFDRFIFANNFGNDTITDFDTHNAERIDLRANANLNSFADVLVGLTNVGGFAQINDGGDLILLQGIAFGSVGVGLAVSAGDFIF